MSRWSDFVTLRFTISERIDTSALLLDLIHPNILGSFVCLIFLFFFSFNFYASKSDSNIPYITLHVLGCLYTERNSEKQLKLKILVDTCAEFA